MRKKSYIKKLRNPRNKITLNDNILTNYDAKLNYKRVVRRIGQVNKRIKDLNKYTNKESYATKLLLDKVAKSGISAKGRRGIRIKKNISNRDLIKIENILNQYLNSETSTIKGIKAVEKRQKQHIKDVLGINEKDSEKILNDDDIETLYRLFESEDFQNIIKKEYMEPSTVWILLKSAKEHDWTLERFKTEFMNYAKATPANKVSDRDLQENIQKIYEKFMYHGLL